MSERIPQSVAKTVVFRAFLASDGKTPATGKTIAITISKNAGAFGNPAAGATNATEISNGFYSFALGTGDINTLGPLVWRGAEGTINDAADIYEVCKATNAGFTALPDAAAGTNGGLPTVDANNNVHGVQPGTGTGQLNPSGGKVPATISAGDVSGNLPANMVQNNGVAQTGGDIFAQEGLILTAVNNLNNLSALANLFGPTTMEIPASGSLAYVLTLTVRDEEGHLVDLTASPTVTAANSAGTDRSTNLSAVTHASTGVYTFTYTVQSSAVQEGLTIKASGTTVAPDSSTRLAYLNCAAVSIDTATAIGAIKTQTDKIGTTAADSSNVTGIKAQTDKIGTTAADSSNVTGIKAKTDNLPAQPASTGDTQAAKLAANGLDSVSTVGPTGVAGNFRERMNQIWRRWFGKAVRSATQIQTFQDDNATLATTQNYTQTSTTETIDAAS